MSYNPTIQKLADAWGIEYNDALDVTEKLDVTSWLALEPWQTITHAGTIDKDSGNTLHGHSGYWVSDGEHIAMITNGDPVWGSVYDQDLRIECELFCDVKWLEGHEI